MSKQGKSRKSLIIGIIAAVVVLGALLAVLLTQCTGGQEATESTPVQTTGEEIPTYELYWNLDRAEYDGKSEAGMSSRQQESDGYFHIRFFFEGETVELRAADRKVINAIDVNDLMGLEFDENGIITGVINIDDMPLEQVGWQFYVQSVGGKLLKLNSSKAYNGLEVLLDIQDFTGIWDMTGLEGDVGISITPTNGDRVIAIANMAGELTHVYVYERPEFMKTFEAECQHCEKMVTWKMWTKTNELPKETGHYQLQNNVSGMSAQQAIVEDGKVCLDLNGMEVDGKDNARVYTLHNSGAQLALMDTSEDQSGVLRGHSTSSDQGGVVWVRYGAFYMYAGTLDGSDMISDMNGAAVDVPKGSYFYMHGGRIIGGNAKAVKNDKGAWTNGLGGTIVVRGKFVMYDGIIEGGKATGVVTQYAADGTPSAYSRGIGGNIYVGSGGEVEMYGGTIKNGTATHSGGNVYVDGTGTFLMEGGTIEGGRVTGKGRNGGNVFVSAKSTFTLKSGRIVGGRSYNCAANLYLNGKVIMTGGYIGDGRIYKWGTNTINATDNRTNVFSVQGDFYMYGGSINGGFNAVDTVADNNPTIVYLTTHATILGSEKVQFDDLVLSTGGDGVTVRVGNLRDTAKIGITATTGIFTEPTSEANVDNFISNVDDAEVCYVDGCLGLGRFSCLCGNNDKGGHYGQCDGTQLFWGPLTSTTLPTKTGNYYLPRVKDADGNLVPRTINAGQQASLAENADVKIDLNGGTLIGQKNFRVISVHNPGAKVTVTDSSEGKTGVMKSHGQGNTQGNVVWTRYGSFDFYGGTLDGSEYVLHTNWNAGTDGIFGTADDKDDGRDGGTVSMGTGTTINMYGGTIIGNTTKAVTLTKTVTDAESGIQTEVTRTVASANGASVSVGNKSVFNMYAGTVRDGISGYSGGNFTISSTGVLNLYGGTISGGQAGPVYAADGTTVVTKGWGGNVDLSGTATLNILSDDVLITAGKAGGNGGNIRVSSASATLNMQAGTVSNGESITDQGGNMFLTGIANLSGGTVTGGKAKNGGNIAINSSKDVLLDGVTVSNGVATVAGGNIGVSTTAKTGVTTIAAGTVITGGQAENGGNVALQTNNANKNNPVATMVITGGTIEKGTATTAGANVYVKGQPDCSASLTISGGTITGGKTPASGGGIYAEGTSTLTMDGGLVTDNVARWGGSIYLSSGTSMTLNKGTITNGSTYDNGSGSSGNGGNIYSTSAVITMNGGTISNGKTGDFGGNVWTQGTFTMNGGLITGGEATASTSKGGGNLYTNNANAKFYLNGGTVENGVAAKGGNIMLNNAGAICVIDGATVTGGQTTSGHGGNINVALGTLTLKSGTISDGVSKDTAGNIYNNGGTVIIEGGKVLGGVDKNGANADESSIYIVSAAIELRGGELDGGVYVYNYKNDNGSIKMSGNPVIKSDTRNGLRIHYSDGATKIPVLQIDQPMTDGAEVYISNTNWGIGKFTTATEESYAKYFHPDDETRSIGFVDNCVALGKTYCLCGSKTATHKLGCDGKQLFWMPTASSSSLPTASGNYYIHPSVTVKLSGQWKPAENAVVNLDLNGRTVTCNARVFAITNANSVVTVTDTASGGKIFKDNTVTHTANDTGMYGGQGAIVWVSGGSTFNLIEGIIDGTGYINTHNGAGICVEGTNSRFNMYGGTVKGTNSVSNGGNVAMKGTNTEMHMYGGSIEGGLTQSTGGNLYIAGTAKVYLHDGTITGGGAGKDYAGGTSNGWGANIEVAGTGYLLIEDGVTVSGGKCLGNGGNIRIGADSVVEMTGGLITGGQTNDNGGNIFVQGTLNVTGGSIEGGRAKNGGNISANTSKTISLSNITISGGEATTGQGGNVRIFNNADATLNLTNVTLTGGSDPKKTTENLDVIVGATVNITDSKIDGGASIVDPAAAITLSGKVEITGAETNLTLGGAMLNLVDFSEESLIGINYAKGGVFTTATEEKFKDNFTSDDPDMSVDFVDGKMVLALGKYYCLCGSTTDTHAPGCDGTEHFWLPWNSSTTLPAESGYWYLTQDVVTLSGQVKITTAQNIYLDLNGKTVKNGEGKNIRFYWISADDCHVTVTDTVGGGNMTNNGQYAQGMIAWVAISGATKAPSFTLIKGTLDVSAATTGNHSVAPNAICLANASCTFNMYGGQVKGGNTPNGGGAIFGENWDSRVNIYGGTVTGHPEEQHPAVRLYGTKNVFSGGTITGGVEINSYRFDEETTKSTNQLTLKSGANVDSILIADLNETRTSSGSFTILPLLTVEGKLADDVTITVTTFNDAPHVYSVNAVDAANEDNFLSGSNNLMAIRNAEGKLEMVANDDPTFHCVCGSTGEHQLGCDGERVRWTEWTSTNSLPKTTGYYYLADHVVLTAQQKITEADQDIYLDLNGKTVSNKADSNIRLYWNAAASNLTITDCSSEQTGTMYNDGTYTQGMIIWLNGAGANFALFNATLNTADAKYAVTDGVPSNTYATSAVCVSTGGSVFNMYSGKIKGGDAPYGGGAVTVGAGSGKFYIWGGTVSKSEKETDAAVLSLGAVYLNGGTVKGGVEFNDSSDGTVSGVWMSGSPKIDFLRLSDKNISTGAADDNLRLLPITITEALELDKPIKLYSFTDGVLTKTAEGVTLDETALDWFSGMTHAIALENGQLKLIGGENVYCVCGSSTEEHAKGCDGIQLVWTEWTKSDALPTAEGNYRLTAPVNVTGQFVMPKDGTLRLDLNGQTVTDTSNRMISTASVNGSGNSTLWITDTSEKQEGKLKLVNSSAYNGQGGIVWVADGSTLNLVAGTLDGSESKLSHGDGGNAVCVQSENGTFNMYGGNVIGGTGKNGAAITVQRGTFNLIGGTVTGGTASEKGGSVFVSTGATVNMSGGKVIGGTSTGNGGNFYFVDNADYENIFNLSGGTITAGTALGGNGGNVWFGNYNVMNMTGGEITDGLHGTKETAAGNGGNVYLSGLMNMSGGTITGGKRNADGNLNYTRANIAITTVGRLVMSGGTIGGGAAPTAAATTAFVTFSGKAVVSNTRNKITVDSIPVYIGKLENGADVNLRVTAASITLHAAEGYTLTEADLAYIHVAGYTLTLDSVNNCIVVTKTAS